LTWNTQSEKDNLGFNVLKSAFQSGPFKAVNSRLIPGQITTSLPAAYSFLDTEVNPSICYYQLEQVNSDGTKAYSPIIAAVRDITAVRTEKPLRDMLQSVSRQNGTAYYTISGQQTRPEAMAPGIYLEVKQDKNGIRKKLVINGVPE
jgi:hypothetical protein